jgi:hypothetical protein
MNPLISALLASTPPSLQSWATGHVDRLNDLPGIRPLRWADSTLGDIYVKPGSEWVNLGAAVDGKRMAWGWSLKQNRWARADVPPEAVLQALHAVGWIEVGDKVAPRAAPRQKAPEAPPPQEPPPVKQRHTGKRDLPPSSMDTVEQPNDGDIVIRVAGSDGDVFHVMAADSSQRGGFRLMAVSMPFNGHRVFYRQKFRGMEDGPSEPGKSGHVDAPDFTWTKIAGKVDRKVYDETRKVIVRDAIGGYLVRYYLQEAGIPFDPKARVYALHSSGYTPKYVDVTGDPDIPYVPLAKDEELSAKAVTPETGDVLWDHNDYITVNDKRRNPYLASAVIHNGERVFNPTVNDEVYSEISNIPAPDLTEANIRKWGMRLLTKYLDASQERIDLIDPVTALEIGSKGYRIHEHTMEKARSKDYKKPTVPRPAPGARLLYRSKASYPWEDVTAGTEPAHLRPPPVPRKFIEPEGELGPLADPRKLRALADGMEKAIQEKLHPAISQQRVTARRAGIGASMEQDARYMQKIQTALRVLADAIVAGDAPKSLLRISSRAAMEDLFSPYQDGFKKRDGTSNIEYLLRETANEKGLTAERRLVQKWLNSASNETPALYDAMTKLCGSKKTYLGVCESASRLKRLARAGLTTETARRDAHSDLHYLLKMRGAKREPTAEETRLQRIKDAERALIGRKIPGYFPTPKELVDDLIVQANPSDGMHILEPSAGKGSIADGIRAAAPGARIDVVEPVGDLRTILEAKGYDVVAYNFLDYEPGEIYDRVVMNPPFEDYQDVTHVLHAYDLLKPGGRLVAIMGEGPFFRSDKKGVAWRHWLEEHGGHDHKNAPGAFQSSDRPTGVATRTVVVEKP